MTEDEQERFENELRRVAPASLPAELVERLRATRVSSQPTTRPEARRNAGFVGWFAGLRWMLAAAAPVVIAIVAIVRVELRRDPNAAKTSPELLR